MKRCGTRGLFRSIVGLLVLLVAPASCLNGLTSDESCGTKVEQQKREAQLRTTVTEMLKVIRSKNSTAFLRYVDKDGVWLWGGNLAPSEIKREFRYKQGLYCLLFSTGCIATTKFPNEAHIDLDRWKISYADWLKQNSPTKTEIDMFYGGEDMPCVANVSIRRINKPRPAQETFELGFRYRNGAWLLRATPAYPEGIACLTLPHRKNRERIEA